MGSGGKNSPKQPDIAPAINAQSAANYMNQYTPYGNITYGGQKKIRIPGQPDAFVPESMNMTLDPAQQWLMNQRNDAAGMLGNLGIRLGQQFPSGPAAQFSSQGGAMGQPAFGASPWEAGRQPTFNSRWGAGGQPTFQSSLGSGQQNPFNPTFAGPQAAFAPTFAGAQAGFDPTFDNPQAAFAPGDFEASRAAAERAVFDRSMSLMRPELERQEEGLRQRLANQGLPQASGAFNKEMGRFETGRGEQMDRLAQSAVLQGLQAQQQGYGQAANTYGMEQQRREQQFGQDIAGFGAEAQRRQQQFGQDIAGYQTEEARRAQQFERDLSGFGAEAQRRQQQFGQDLAGYQTEAQRRATQYGQEFGKYQSDAQRAAAQYQQELTRYQTEAQRRATQFGQDLSGFQANQGQRAQQLQEILGMFGLQGTQLPQQAQMPQIDIPWQQQQQGGGGGPMTGLMGLAGAGLGAYFSPPGMGMQGAGMGMQMGSSVPSLFGY